MSVHAFLVRVYYEDTDAGGVVYYANYLKFAERARTEMLRAAGVDQSALAAEQDMLFVVRRAELDLQAPAKLDDELRIETQVIEMRGASLKIRQVIFCGERILVEVVVVVACVNGAFRPRKILAEVRDKLEKLGEE